MLTQQYFTEFFLIRISALIFVISTAQVAASQLYRPDYYQTDQNRIFTYSLAFINNRFLAVSYSDGSIIAYDSQNKKKVTVFNTNKTLLGEPIDLCLKDTILFAQGYETVDFFNLNKIGIEDYELSNRLIEKIRTIRSQYFSALLPSMTDDSYFCCQYENGILSIKKRDITTDTQLVSIAIDAALPVFDFAQDPNSRTLACIKTTSSFEQPSICSFLDDRTLDLVHMFPTRAQRVHFIPGGEHYALIKDDNLCFYDQKTHQVLRTIKTQGFISKIAIDPTGKYIALVSHTLYDLYSTVGLFCAKTGELLWHDHYSKISSKSPSMSFSPDGKLLALGSDLEGILFFDVEKLATLEEQEETPTHQSWICAIS